MKMGVIQQDWAQHSTRARPSEMGHLVPDSFELPHHTWDPEISANLEGTVGKSRGEVLMKSRIFIWS